MGFTRSVGRRKTVHYISLNDLGSDLAEDIVGRLLDIMLLHTSTKMPPRTHLRLVGCTQSTVIN
jgi:hypothetical protein